MAAVSELPVKPFKSEKINRLCIHDLHPPQACDVVDQEGFKLPGFYLTTLIFFIHFKQK